MELLLNTCLSYISTAVTKHHVMGLFPNFHILVTFIQNIEYWMLPIPGRYASISINWKSPFLVSVLFFFSCSVLGTENKALCVLAKCSVTGSHPSFWLLFLMLDLNSKLAPIFFSSCLLTAWISGTHSCVLFNFFFKKVYFKSLFLHIDCELAARDFINSMAIIQ